jgi:type I restriction enzyme S subunit
VRPVPPGWVSAPLGEVADIVAGQAPPGASYNKVGNGTPLYQGKTDFGDLCVHAPRLWTTQPSKHAHAQDVLLSVRAPVGPTNLAADSCAIGRGLAAIRGRGGVSQRYLLYAIRATVGELQARATGTTFSAITKPVVREHLVPIAPVPEQERIVAAIEEQLSRLDAGLAALARVQENLKQMRASVLEATMTGSLIRGDPTAPGSQALLSEILDLRRRASVGARRRYRDPALPLTARIPLPDHWTWASLDMLAASDEAITDGPFGSNLKSVHYTQSGPRVIRLQNIGDGEFIDVEAHISEEHYERLSKHAAEPGDLVAVLLGDTVPRACVIPEGLGRAIVKADCPRIRLSPLVNHRYVWAALNAPSTRSEVSSRVHGMGRPRLNLRELRQIPIPLPPREDQDLLVAVMDEQLSEISRLAAEVASDQHAGDALRSSILTSAFLGKLVPQDHNDEPASVLLERIAANRASSDERKPAGGRSQHRKKATA